MIELAFELWIELMVLQTIIGYCFAVANEFIGLNFIKDLNVMKGDIKTVRLHKTYGRIEIMIFYALTIQCIFMLYMHVAANDPNLYTPSGVWAHSWWGGFFAFALVMALLGSALAYLISAIYVKVRRGKGQKHRHR